MEGILIFSILFAFNSGTFADPDLLQDICVVDPDLLQDICVADLASGVKVNGFTCKPGANVTSTDFFFTRISKPGLTNNTLGALVTGAAFNSQLPGTQSLAVALFGSTPPMPDNVLTKAFQIGSLGLKKFRRLKSRLAPKK